MIKVTEAGGSDIKTRGYVPCPVSVGFRGGAAEPIGVGSGEPAKMGEAPLARDGADIPAGRGKAQFFVHPVQAQVSQVCHGARVEITAKSCIERTAADAGDGDQILHRYGSMRIFVEVVPRLHDMRRNSGALRCQQRTKQIIVVHAVRTT